MSKTERSPDELALSPRALADAQNAAAAEIVGRAFERGLSEEDVALALREREAAQAAAAAGATGTAAEVSAGAAQAALGADAPQAALGAGAPIQGGEALSADDAAELARDTIPRRGPLALPRVVAATKPRMQGVALPVPEHDPSLASSPGARGERESDEAPVGMPRGSRAWPVALVLLGAGALGVWWWSKGDPPQQPNHATSAVPMGSEPVRVPPPPDQTTSSVAAPTSASAVPQMAPTASVSGAAAVPSAKASAKASATADATGSTKPSATPRPSATPTPPSSGTPPTPSAKPSSWFVPQ